MSIPKIEKNIPIPDRKIKLIDRYNLAEMEVGDSIFLAGKQTRDISNIVAAFRRYPGNLYWNYTSEPRSEDGVKGVRFWRIKDRTTLRNANKDKSTDNGENKITRNDAGRAIRDLKNGAV
jgi:hypothetical protein